jgi:hypothetical protein
MDHQLVGCCDAVLLENESEENFLLNLSLRFKRDSIYVRLEKEKTTTTTTKYIAQCQVCY